MVQTRPHDQDMGSAELYRVGCAGRLTAFSETHDGRYLVTLSGLIRFDILEELPLDVAGYRCVRPDFLGYDDDLAGHARFDLDQPARDRFMQIMRDYFQAKGFETDWETVGRAASALPDHITGYGLPLCPCRKTGPARGAEPPGSI